jgi:DNA repair exonuclease SbcCD ATPase subunit
MNMCYEYSIPEQVITCPYCNKEIPLTEAISHKILEKLQKEFEGQAKKIEKDAKQIERVLRNISGMYGDMEGVFDVSLPQKRVWN